MNDNLASLNGSQISMPLIELLSEKLDFEATNVFNFTLMPLQEHVVFAWNEHDLETGQHPLVMEVLDYDVFNDIAEQAIQTIKANGTVTDTMVRNAMEHVEILDELGATMGEYPMLAAYLGTYYPGLLEFEDDDARGALVEALTKVREGWEL